MCRHNVMGKPWVPNWTDIKTVLSLYDLWTKDIQLKLELMFETLLLIEHQKEDGVGNNE